MIKNTANTLKVFAFDRDTAIPKTGDASNITCKVSLNGGALVSIADTNPTELEDGYYLFDITAAESNGVTADFFPESSTSKIQVICAEHSRYLESPVSGLVGGGSVNFPLTITDPSSNPIDGVALWVTTNAGGTDVIAGTIYTNGSGTASFMLDPGTYYLWMQRNGYNFTNPQQITVT